MPGGRDGGGRGRGRKDMSREEQVSRKITWLLRHGAQGEGLKLGKGGYVNVGDVLKTNAFKSLKITFPELRDAVVSNSKQRFALVPTSYLSSALNAAAAPSTSDASTIAESTEPAASPPPPPAAPFTLPDVAALPDTANPRDYLIRANQGHSLKVDANELLTPITLDSELPELVVHGTDHGAWKKILRSGGLRTMGRNHVHFAAGLPAGFGAVDDDEGGGESKEKEKEAPVISGMRTSSTVLIYLDIRAALEAGLVFGRSENNVILTAGDEKGFVGYRFFKRVEDRVAKKVLMRDGVLPEGVEVDSNAAEEVVESGKGRRGGKGGGAGRGRGKGKERVRVVDDSGDLLAGV